MLGCQLGSWAQYWRHTQLLGAYELKACLGDLGRLPAASYQAARWLFLLYLSWCGRGTAARAGSTTIFVAVSTWMT